MERRPFTPHGLLALEPKAFGTLADLMQRSEGTLQDHVAVVTIRGPLMQHGGGWWWDSYDAIVARVDAALQDRPKAIVLKIDSPGGVIGGAFEAARKLREMTAEADVPLYAYVDGQATSAGYALASSAQEIVVTPTSIVGSVGVICALFDQTKLNQEIGLAVTLVTSGARKADGHPDAPTSDGAVASTQKMVNEMAEAFFELIADHRSGLNADALRELEAATMLGPEAVARGLADTLGSFDSLLARASGTAPAPAGNEDSMDEKEEEARKALQAILDDEDADEKAKSKARKALAAMDEDDSEANDDEDAKGEDDDKDAKGEDEETVSAKSAGAAVSTLTAQVAELLKDKEDRERAELFASRPDLDENLVKVLKGMPLAAAKKIVAATPKATPKPAAASSTVPATRGAGQGGGTAPELPPAEAAAMDAAMGLTKTKPGVKKEGATLYLGASLPSNPKA